MCKMWEEFQGTQKQWLNNSCIIGTKGLKYFSHYRVKNISVTKG